MGMVKVSVLASKECKICSGTIEDESLNPSIHKFRCKKCRIWWHLFPVLVEEIPYDFPTETMEIEVLIKDQCPWCEGPIKVLPLSNNEFLCQRRKCKHRHYYVIGEWDRKPKKRRIKVVFKY